MKKFYIFMVVMLILFAKINVNANPVTTYDENDPLISLSYLSKDFSVSIKESGEKIIKDTLGKVSESVQKIVNPEDADSIYRIVAKSVEKYMKDYPNINNFSNNYHVITIHKGDKIYGTLGTKFMLMSGNSSLYGECKNFINISLGRQVDISNRMDKNYQYFQIEKGDFGILADENYTNIAVCGGYRIDKAYDVKYKKMADGLYNIGLFKGTNTGYDLDRSATRIEALVMLIRLLGEEETALKCDFINPFDDVESWADRYVAYAYNKGYTNGVSETKFNPSDTTNAIQYTTFILRALGYDDRKGDFEWNKSIDFCIANNILSMSEKSALNIDNVFRRDNLVYLSCKALYSRIKGTKMTILQSMIADGIVDSRTVEANEKNLKNII